MSYFYSHLVKVDNLVVALEELELSDDQKNHLTTLADSTVHHSILDLILSQLSHEDKITFVKMLNENPRDEKLLEFLNTKIEKIEKQIEDTATKIHSELHEDIKESHRRVGKNK
jgi:hypothetical protein